MKTFLFIMAAILWVGFKSYKNKVRQLSDSEESSETNQASTKSAFESLFDAREEVSEKRDDEKAGIPNNYFSYETQNGSDECDVCTSSESKVDAASNNVATEAEAINFDLRQAVINQTILSNKYLDEMHSFDN